ncbi:hypothetical protein AB4876_16180 [Zhongshania guokunii]|uniref:Uncharacterized protein n=1 Tax=Zhongshania guokunii TaxID=641783 RepID=A0ABV3UAF9_9GAMM
MKEKIAIGIGIVSFGFIDYGLGLLADILGLPRYFDLGDGAIVTRGSGRYSYDQETIGGSTDISYYFLFVSAMFAWRVYHWALSGKIRGNIPLESRITWSFWFFGMTAYIVVTTPIWKIDMPSIVQRLVVLICAGGIAWVAYNKHGKVMMNIRSSDGNDAK